MKDVLGHMASTLDTEKEGPKIFVNPHGWSNNSEWNDYMRKNTYLRIRCLLICQMSWISYWLTTERRFRKQRQAHVTASSMLYQPSVTVREVLTKEGRQRKLPRCDSGESTGRSTVWHCWLVSSWSNKYFWFVSVHSIHLQYMTQECTEDRWDSFF